MVLEIVRVQAATAAHMAQTPAAQQPQALHNPRQDLLSSAGQACVLRLVHQACILNTPCSDRPRHVGTKAGKLQALRADKAHVLPIQAGGSAC